MWYDKHKAIRKKYMSGYRQKAASATILSAGQPVKCITTDKTFPSAGQAAKEYSLHAASILKVCRGEQKATKGYVFVYA